MKSIARFAFAASVVVASGAAMAADLPTRGPAAAPVFAQKTNWNGAFVGVWAGYHWGDVQQICFGICPVNPKLEGFVVGVNGGYNWTIGSNTVVGVLVTAPVTRISETYNLGVFSFKTTPQFAGMIAGRVGFAMGDFLPYAFLGVGAAKNKIKSDFGVSDSATHFGPVLGAGVEWAFQQKWSLDLRYTYLSAPKEVYTFGPGPTQKFGSTGHTLSLGVNYRFGSVGGPVVARY
jgi:opacity protein-like surface antigen